MAEDTMFQETVEALRQGNKARAKELLTLLLKADQHNATYWVWMSAAVDNVKERIYCLQTALNLDPENATAKRGLVLLGALPPDETIQPFPLNHPRAWEEKLLLAHEISKPTGIGALASNPVARLAALGVVGILILGLAFSSYWLPRANRAFLSPTFTAGPSPTYSPTPTLIGATAAVSPTFIGPTPLWAFLDATYTPTPFYVNTPRQPQSYDQYRAAKAAYNKQDWPNFILNMQEVARLEPQAADVQYFIGEAYRFEGDTTKASNAYNEALKIDPKFSPAYLGLARVRLMQEPGADVTQLFDLALQYDPNYGEVYLERATYNLNHNDPQAALADFGSAKQRMPDSPLVYLGFARSYVALGDPATALENARKANELDITLLPVYLILGETNILEKNYSAALKALQTYTTYEPNDGRAFALLGQMYYETGDYQTALSDLNQGIKLDPTQRQVYLYRGLTFLEMNNAKEAQADLQRAAPFFENSYDINLGLTRAFYMQEQYGNAYLQIETTKSLAESDEQKATVLYWRALINEKRGQLKDATQDWQSLLKMPKTATTTDMRTEAEQHIKDLSTPTVTPTKTPTPTIGARTRTPTPTNTPTPKGGAKTPTPTPTLQTPTATRTPTP